jgi:hypothetical protein
MSVTATPAIPKTEPETRKRQGQTEVKCKWCQRFKPETPEFWMTTRDQSVIYSKQRCRTCQASYRAELAAKAKSGEREVKSRGDGNPQTSRIPKQLKLDNGTREHLITALRFYTEKAKDKEPAYAALLTHLDPPEPQAEPEPTPEPQPEPEEAR